MGIYAIYVGNSSSEHPQYFYLGMSEKGICKRLSIHFYNDIKKNYRQLFAREADALEIVLCYCTAKLKAGARARSIMELLELCLSVAMRPKFPALVGGLSPGGPAERDRSLSSGIDRPGSNGAAATWPDISSGFTER